uniref:Uncharacterized protein n=1 Tax=Anguilla anguilla TaxID=7936 RepID=A0A0E9UNY9_ANGAN
MTPASPQCRLNQRLPFVEGRMQISIIKYYTCISNSYTIGKKQSDTLGSIQVRVTDLPY